MGNGNVKSTVQTIVSAATLIGSSAVILGASRGVFTAITKKQGGSVLAMAAITLLVGAAAFRYSMNELKTE